MDKIHVSKMGTYHPAEDSEVAWTVNDTRGYLDGGPACDECGACECGPCEECGANPSCICEEHNQNGECIGLSFAYVCLDGGDALCSDCFDKANEAEVVDCDCGRVFGVPLR